MNTLLKYFANIKYLLFNPSSFLKNVNAFAVNNGRDTKLVNRRRSEIRMRLATKPQIIWTLGN